MRWGEQVTSSFTRCAIVSVRYNIAMSYGTVIVAAGRGTRAGGRIPKQYRNLRGVPVLRHTIEAILAVPQINQLVLVISPEDQALLVDAIATLSDARITDIVYGGDTRSDSVVAGLEKLTTEFALIHDGARPLIDAASMNRVLDKVTKTGAAFCALPVTDALWAVSGGNATDAMPRDTLWRAQTPQAFRTTEILAAHQSSDMPADDDVAMARRSGIAVTPVMGSERNIKITQPEDFALAEQLLGSQMDIRTGSGYDVHALGEGDHVILNGINIAHDAAMIGHSDADVAMHAITDALFGAVAQGDIGRWFPPTDPQWKGAASDIFLRKAAEVVREAGFEISNIDCTIICEMPKITPHATAMRENLSHILALSIDRISVKATTSERLGFTGRGEGIAAQATATVTKG